MAARNPSGRSKGFELLDRQSVQPGAPWPAGARGLSSLQVRGSAPLSPKKRRAASAPAVLTCKRPWASPASPSPRRASTSRSISARQWATGGTDAARSELGPAPAHFRSCDHHQRRSARASWRSRSLALCPVGQNCQDRGLHGRWPPFSLGPSTEGAQGSLPSPDAQITGGWPEHEEDGLSSQGPCAAPERGSQGAPAPVTARRREARRWQMRKLAQLLSRLRCPIEVGDRGTAIEFRQGSRGVRRVGARNPCRHGAL